MYKILAINPGSTSTKFAVYFDTECVLNKTLRHSFDELLPYKNVISQFDFRKALIIDAIVEEGIDVDEIKYIIGRGGLTYPLESGVYAVSDLMIKHLKENPLGEHASNLGPLLADYIANQIPNACALIADPVVTDELNDIARVSGHPKFERRSIFHALNQKAIAKLHASVSDKKYEEMNLIVAHLGGGISVGAHQKGKVIDVNNGFDGEGAFSPERSGTLPVGQLIDLCFDEKYSIEEVKRFVVGEGGFVAYLGTNNALDVENRANKGDKEALFIQEALSYQVSKMIGEMAVVLNGKVDAILLTGGLAYNKMVVEYLKKKTSFLGKLFVYPGEDELRALAINALGVAKGEIAAKIYDKQPPA